MTWARGGPVNPKYRTAEHRNLRAKYVRKIKAGEPVECAATVCVIGDRTITETDGRKPHGLHLGHHDDGTTYRGPEHRACNLRDAAVRARARQARTSERAAPKRWVL